MLMTTEFGWVSATWTESGLYRLCFGDASPQDSIRRLGDEEFTVDPGNSDDELESRLKQFFAGDPDSFGDIPVDHRNRTLFQKQVLEACRAIPWGETRSYGELAAEVGAPRAARAVGTVMANNRVPLIIPCHRVLAANQRLGGYSAPGGLDLKRRLLQLEGTALA